MRAQGYGWLAPVVLLAACGAGSGSAPTGTCPAGGEEGTWPGDVLPQMEVSRCDGTTVALSSIACGHPLTLLDIGAAAFPACVKATDRYATAADFDALQARGLHIVQVFTLDSGGSPASKSFCEAYVAEHAIDFEFLIDPLGRTDDIAPVHPFQLVLDVQGRVVHHWEVVIPPDQVETLGALLDGGATD